ncbi:DinB family protein [Paraflavitalea sp. CAU 1676]|uniref:DinB family protein n=1 Tax=Paraflavitalea sp. CAU 1676 TaxID=3032598 RepID=UPI0023DC3DA9|nr:DinB family protein [Paraflavitalea sp. CAU 1676]MDF2187896.1 DinB family protein [Paraflavitalea sp. CAU 1676]
MNASKWFDRKFNFSFGTDEYTALYQRLQHGPDILASVLIDMSDHVLAYQPAGKWSIKEHIGHLSILEPLWRTRMHDIVEKKPILTPTDLDNKATTEAGFNNYAITDLFQQFVEERRKTLSLLGSIDIQEHQHTSLHPRLQQPMRLIDIIYFTVEHDDHHTNVIQELIKTLK